MDFLNFIRKVHEEKKAQSYVIKAKKLAEGEGRWVTIRGKPVFISTRSSKEFKPKNPKATANREVIGKIIEKNATSEDEDLIAEATTEVVDKMKEQYGEFTEDWEEIDYSYVDNALYRWSVDSHDKGCIWLQVAAEKEFGSKMSDFTLQRLGKEKPLDMDVSDEQNLLRTIYDKTQGELRAHGIDSNSTVVLHRGCAGKPIAGKGLALGNAIESWTTSREIAEFYVKRNAEQGKEGFVMTAEVPIKQILSLPHTGMGLGSVKEVVVLGGTPFDAVAEKVKL